MNKSEELKAQVAAAEADANQFYTKGNKAAGTRLRATFQTIKGLAHEGRNEVTELKKKKDDETPAW